MILVTGATGYVGRAVVDRLVADGRPVRALVRSDDARLPGGVERARGDVTDESSLRAAAEGVEAIVHLVAIIDGSDAAFDAVNARGPANVVSAAHAARVRRVIHMSALGVSAEHAGLTRYWSSKWQGASAVTASDLDWTVIEPSFVFGGGGGALASFEQLLRLPVVPVIGDGRYRHQVVWIGDVAAAFSRALDRPETVGKRIPLVGPQPLAFDDLLDELARVTGRPRRRKLHLPVGFMKAQAAVLRFFPPPLKVTREQIAMLLAGTEASVDDERRLLGIEPASLADAYAR